MSFEDEKFVGSWGALFFAFLGLINFDLAPNFWWKEFLATEVALALFVFLRFRKTINSTIVFYKWGLFIWGTLFFVYSAFTLFVLGSVMGMNWLWLAIPVWLALTVELIRRTVRWEDGSTSANTGMMTWAAAIGASFSGVLAFYFSKAAIALVLAVVLDVLLSFVMVAYFTVCLRHLLKLRQQG